MAPLVAGLELAEGEGGLRFRENQIIRRAPMMRLDRGVADMRGIGSVTSAERVCACARSDRSLLRPCCCPCLFHARHSLVPLMVQQ